MTSEENSPNASQRKNHAADLVYQWLRDENEYQFNKNFLTHRGHPKESRNYILNTEIPNKWHRFQHFRGVNTVEPKDQKLRLHVGQNILKACAAARAAYVWDEVDKDEAHDLYLAQGKSWVLLDGFLEGVKDKKRLLPGYRLLEEDVCTAVDTYAGREGAYMKPLAVYIGMTALSITALIEQTTHQTLLGHEKELMIPLPGVPSGTISRWDPIN